MEPSRPTTAISLAPPNSIYNQTSASARTSYTHVDVDSPSPPPQSQSPVQLVESGASPAAPQTVGGAGAVEVIPQTPQTTLTFLLVSGKRRTMSFEPETTVGRVKELVWGSWPSDSSDSRPPAPSFLRILYLGRILQDEDTLCIHLSIRTFLPPPHDDCKKHSKWRASSYLSSGNTGTGGNGNVAVIGADGRPGGTGDERGAGCCCIIC